MWEQPVEAYLWNRFFLKKKKKKINEKVKLGSNNKVEPQQLYEN